MRPSCSRFHLYESSGVTISRSRRRFIVEQATVSEGANFNFCLLCLLEQPFSNCNQLGSAAPGTRLLKRRARHS
ncbi:uncharacterized protein LACBIDRAFT_298264 [Laccaria bicolor S238N-H82]|uniref:Predicted protein n=1 Tax=Laccaria bicolor (strain S238N-H82 / ATCC MYA-4686) TaxID=486041 RepID=B0DCL0_LACBS|nr:uncharacterized protein LACBIDRAFT_298264 [Laccaria bicolor S238N-H82]EDR07916.1 predicted protein [Laccaria bicolor S238N-H82]|eukprot:XP_001881705.1 predicted protein [Laccaria bicolor S238N-H82]